MTGKSGDFSTVKGETAIITFYDILPGEKALKLTSYTSHRRCRGILFFKANGMGNETPKAPFRYEGRVTKGKLILNMAISKWVMPIYGQNLSLRRSLSMEKILVISDTWEMNIHGRRLMDKMIKCVMLFPCRCRSHRNQLQRSKHGVMESKI